MSKKAVSLHRIVLLAAYDPLTGRIRNDNSPLALTINDRNTAQSTDLALKLGRKKIKIKIL